MKKVFAATAISICIAIPSYAGSLSPGDCRFQLETRDGTRSYLVHMPPQSAVKPLPLVVYLHGGGGNAQQFKTDSGTDEAADRDGYIAVYPNGSGRQHEKLLTWNAGNCCAYAQEHQIDDVGFVSAVLDDIEKRADVDRRRIYVAGHSNGGMMAHRIGEMLPDRVAAIASIAGGHIPSPAAGRAMPVMHIHSVDDPRALYVGGLGPPFPFTSNRVLHPSVDSVLSAWVKYDQCAMPAVEKDYRNNGKHTAKMLVYENCRDGAEVVLWKLTGAGHGWPGQANVRESLTGPATNMIDANLELWKFFSRFSLPEKRMP